MSHSRRFYIKWEQGWASVAVVRGVANRSSWADPGPGTHLASSERWLRPNHFRRYLGEIPACRGLNSFDVIDISSLSAAELANTTWRSWPRRR